MGDFYKDVGELGSLQGICLPQRGLMGGDKEGGEQPAMVETRITRLIEPLKERRRILLASKEMHQVAQDLEDEIVRNLKKYKDSMTSSEQQTQYIHSFILL